MHTGFTQVALSRDHKQSSYAFVGKVKAAIGEELPEMQTFYSSGSLVDDVPKMGAPAPIDVRLTAQDVSQVFAQKIATTIGGAHGVVDVYIPQEIDCQSLRISVDRTHASQLGIQ